MRKFNPFKKKPSDAGSGKTQENEAIEQLYEFEFDKGMPGCSLMSFYAFVPRVQW